MAGDTRCPQHRHDPNAVVIGCRCNDALAVAVPAETSDDERHEIEVDDLIVRVMELSSLLRGMARRAGGLRIRGSMGIDVTSKRWARLHQEANAERDNLREKVTALSAEKQALADAYIGTRDAMMQERSRAREAIANRDSNVNYLLGRVAAVRALADKVEADNATAVEHGSGHAYTRASAERSVARRIRAVLDGSAGSPDPTLVGATKCHSCQSAAKAVAGSPETGDTAPAGDRIDVYVRMDNEKRGGLRQEEVADGVILDWRGEARPGGVERLVGVEVLDVHAVEINGQRVERGSDTTPPDPAALLTEAAVEPLRRALYIVERTFEPSADGDALVDALVLAVLNANWRPAAALAGTAPTRQQEAFDDGPGVACGCCEIDWQLCRGLYDKGMARCCSDCTHNLSAIPTPPPLVGTYADPDFVAHQDHKHPVEGCGFCSQEEDR